MSDEGHPPASLTPETVQQTSTPPALRRLLLVITEPTAAFRGLEAERFSWLLPALVVSLLMVAAPQLLHSLHVEKQAAGVESLIDRGLLSEEQALEARQRLEEGLEDRGPGKVALQMLLGLALQIALRYLLPAALLLAGVRFVMEGRAGYAAVLGAVAYASVPAGIREIVRTPWQAAQGSLEVFFGPAAVTGSRSVGGYALSLLDLFDIWILALLILAISTVGQISRGRAAGVVLPLWIVYSLAKIGIKASPFGASL